MACFCNTFTEAVDVPVRFLVRLDEGEHMHMHRQIVIFLTVVAATISSSRLLAQDIGTPPGFRVDRIYDVPKTQGSWVCMTFDGAGRLIASHESGGLYRLTLPTEQSDSVVVEKIAADPGPAHGLLWAHNSLYVVSGGVWRLQDTTGDGQFDVVVRLVEIKGRGEHGPHAIVPSPDGDWLYVVAGNATAIPDGLTANRVAAESGTRLDPQGWVMRINPDASTRELWCVGLRNSYGLAVHPCGDLFTFDSDNEGFMGLPWYRPANLYHVVSGADYGWRQGPDTRQSWHPDNLPSVSEIGPGSPTGMTFGTGADFPARYQRALFLCDWSYGRIYAVQLTPSGSTWRSTEEVFATGRPLAVTDIRVGPDGNMYFVTGGRGTASAVYRISWEGDAVTTAPKVTLDTRLRGIRETLETLHDSELDDGEIVDRAWLHLRSDDRNTRYAARTAIEKTPVKLWVNRVKGEMDVDAALEGLIALSRQLSPDKDTSAGHEAILSRLNELPWDLLTQSQRMAYLRVVHIVQRRLGPFSAGDRQQLLDRFDPLFPSDSQQLNRELVELLVTLKADSLAERTINVLQNSPSAMNQIHYLRWLGRGDVTFTDEQKKRLHTILDLEMIRDTGSRGYKDVTTLIQSLLSGVDAVQAKAEPFPVIRKWTKAELSGLAARASLKEAAIRRGQHAFRKATCHRCHRIGASGGTLGPNLTTLASRYQAEDVLESILDPSKVIADQYRTTVFIRKNGAQFTGQIVNLSGDNYQVRLDPAKPFPRVNVPISDIDEMVVSPVSPMPKGLLNVLTRAEIRDLLGYLMQPR